jgi:biopolymer transport protein TolR
VQSGSGSSESDIISGINVTPLVDITLVLLIIFIVTAKIIVTPAVPLDLPRAAKTDEVQLVFSVIIPVQGAVLVNGTATKDDGELLGKAKAAVAADAEVRAVIQADGGVTHRTMIRVLDLLRQGGMERIAFAALPPEDVKPVR